MDVNLATGKRTLLDNRHPDYLENAADWKFWEESYLGGPRYRAGGHLFRFQREPEKWFKDRLKRADRNNFTRQILDIVVTYVFKETITRKEDKASDTLKAFWQDVDRQGTGIGDFMRSIGTKLGIFGKVFIVVDKPAQAAQTLLEQQQKRLFPYAYRVSPLDVLDYTTDAATGQITGALIREWTRGEIDLLQARESDNLQERFRLWYQQGQTVGWKLYKRDDKQEPVLIEEGLLSGMSRVPIVCRGRTGGSLIGDVATLDRSVYNYNSLLDQILYDQTFSQLILPWDGKIQAFFDEWEMVLGTKAILPYPKDAEGKPEYISPDASQAATIETRIEKKVDQIYRIANLQDTVGQTSMQGSGAESGVAKGYDFEKLNAGLATYADDLEKIEEDIATLVNLWEGVREPLDDMLIDYPDTFQVKAMAQELNEYNLLSVSIQSERFKKLAQKQIVRKAMPKLEQTDMDAIMKEIDDAKDPAEEQKKTADDLRK